MTIKVLWWTLRGLKASAFILESKDKAAILEGELFIFPQFLALFIFMINLPKNTESEKIHPSYLISFIKKNHFFPEQ